MSRYAYRSVARLDEGTAESNGEGWRFRMRLGNLVFSRVVGYVKLRNIYCLIIESININSRVTII